MKLLICFSMAVLVFNNGYSQDENYAGPAKMYVKSFWGQVAILKKGGGSMSTINNLQKAIAGIKDKDPGFSTSAMENEIKTWTEKYKQTESAASNKANEMQANMNASRTATLNRTKVKKLLDELFDISIFTIRDPSKANDEINAYDAKLQELLNMQTELDAYKADEKEAREYTRFVEKMKLSLSRNLDMFIDRTEKILSQTTGEKNGNWENAYYEMKAEQIHWDAAQKVFPGEPAFSAAYVKMKNLVSKYGSLDDIQAMAKENNKSKIAGTKLPPAATKDPVMEKAYVDAFNKRYRDQYKGTAIKAILLQTGWQTERNELTGVVTGRIQQGAIVYKGDDGKCYLVSIMHLYQEYIGNAFQNTKAIYSQNGQEMLCENVK